MRLKIYQVDSFTDRIFGGNPACVVQLSKWLPDEIMLKIALENAVAETAFFIREGERFSLRWFTPDLEMDLCGHATLATAHIIRTFLGWEEEIVFNTAVGKLGVVFSDGIYNMGLPSRKALPEMLPYIIRESLSIKPKEVLKARDYVLVYDSEEDIRNIAIDRILFDKISLGKGGVAVTAPGKNCDFVSRFFTPQATILEDYVTGSAHCSLIPYWSQKLGRLILTAEQLSSRPGKLYCEDLGDTVTVGGQAVTYFAGELILDGFI